MHIANCKICKNLSLDVENAILIIYYQQTVKTTAIYESITEPAGQPAGNLPDLDWLEE
jgi:hypothetical protein